MRSLLPRDSARNLTRTPAIYLASALVLGLSACGGGASDGAATAPSSAPASTTTSAAPTTESGTSASATSSPAAASGSVSDICALLSPTEVSSVIGTATVDRAASFGSLTDATGGQCIWSTGTSAYAADAVNLELIAWAPDGPNPAPAEAVKPGDKALVKSEDGAYFASADRSMWLRVTGSTATKAQGEKAQQLAQQLASRL